MIKVLHFYKGGGGGFPSPPRWIQDGPSYQHTDSILQHPTERISMISRLGFPPKLITVTFWKGVRGPLQMVTVD